MNKSFSLLTLLFVAVFGASCSNQGSHDQKKVGDTPGAIEEVEVIEIAPERDRNGNARTTNGAASETDTDRQLTQNIRRSLANDEILARYVAIKVVSKNGDVLLRGFVETMQDKAAVEKKIRALNGVKKVDNQLEVTPSAPHAR